MDNFEHYKMRRRFGFRNYNELSLMEKLQIKNQHPDMTDEVMTKHDWKLVQKSKWHHWVDYPEETTAWRVLLA